MNSILFRLSKNEAVKGLAVAVFGTIVASGYQLIKSGGHINAASLQTIGLAGLGAGVSYLGQKFFRNSNDELLKKETVKN